MGYLVRLALIIGAAALFAGCGGSQPPIGAPGSERAALTSHQKTFSYTGKKQTFTVPSGVTRIDVDARGAQGGGSYGGLGGHVVALIDVTPGQKFHVLVGGQPSAMSGGFNGGGSGGTPSGCKYYCGYGGGGASDMRAHMNRIVVAGGGGGQGGDGYPGYAGGSGGGGGAEEAAAGATGVPYGGYGGFGGTQHHGGDGGAEGYGSTGNGAPGAPGALGDGGAGGQGCVPTGSRCGDSGANGGGGGGGYYGGGGGGAGPGSIYVVGGGGGGGGSSYIERGAKALVDTRGWKNAIGNGLIIVTW